MRSVGHDADGKKTGSLHASGTAILTTGARLHAPQQDTPICMRVRKKPLISQGLEEQDRSGPMLSLERDLVVREAAVSRRWRLARLAALVVVSTRLIAVIATATLTATAL